MRIAFLLLALASGALSAAAAPPKVYVQDGACPSECCTYGRWSVLKDCPLFDRPHGKRVGALSAGQKAEALGGQIRVVPTKLTVTHSQAHAEGFSFAKGKALYVLAPEGEGYYSVWYEGKVRSLQFDRGFGDYKACAPPSADCWLRLHKDNSASLEWWARFKTAQGEAWGRVRAGVFDGTDSCS